MKHYNIVDDGKIILAELVNKDGVFVWNPIHNYEIEDKDYESIITLSIRRFFYIRCPIRLSEYGLLYYTQEKIIKVQDDDFSNVLPFCPIDITPVLPGIHF